MVEFQPLVNEEIMTYEGLFSVKELYSMIESYAKKHGFVIKEPNSSEQVTKTGRNIVRGFDITRQLSDYARSQIKLTLKLNNVKDVVVEKEGIKKNLNQGKITCVFYVYLQTDFEHRWENKPGFFFIRVLFDKYLFKPFTTNYSGITMKDYTLFYNELKAHLNLYKY